MTAHGPAGCHIGIKERNGIAGGMGETLGDAVHTGPGAGLPASTGRGRQDSAVWRAAGGRAGDL